MLSLILYALAGFAAIATLLGCLGQFWWGFELLDHPRPQYCLLLLPAIALALLHRHPQQSAVWWLPLLFNLFLILPLFMAPNPDRAQAQAAVGSQPSAPSERLKILHINLDRDNANPYAALQYIDDQEADLVFLQEVTPDWLNRLQTDLKHYQLFTAEPQDNSQGSALFLPINANKNIKILDTQIIYLPATSDRPLLQTTIFWANSETVVLSLHVIRPRSPETSAYQVIEFNEVAQWSQQQQQEKRNVVVIGDFNSTPWSSRFRHLLTESHLINSQSGFGLQPTWPAILPAPLMIAIDHCLHSASLRTHYRMIGQGIGSDHLPLYVELQQKLE